MSRPNPIYLTAALAGIVAVLAGATLARGGFWLTKHEGDTLHLLQIVFRMADGEWPHLDFMTPIGVLAFAPMAWLVEQGMGVGHAIVWSQILLAALLLPALVWTGVTRLDGWLAYLYGGLVLLLTLALVYGEAERAVSISMHYNRWAWAVSYVAILLAVMPARGRRGGTVDGVIVGLCMAALALCKVTYFAAFAVPVVLALALRGAYLSLAVAVAAGLAAAAAVTLAAGVDFWPAYLSDLLAVSGSEVRPQPGEGLRAIVAAPQWLGASLALMAGVILLRRAGAGTPGLILLLLAPGFVYVTWQNFGNDPQWLPLVGVLLLAHRPDAADAAAAGLRRATEIAAMAVFALAAPSLFNLGYSPFRHLAGDAADYVPMLAAMPEHADLQVRKVRASRVDGRVALDGPGSGLEDRTPDADRAATRTEFRGEVLPECELQLGMGAWFETIVADMEAEGLAGGRRVYAADVISGHWLFGDLQRLPGGAPWYYGGLPGFEAADWLLVPLCPVGVAVRKQVLEAVAERGVGLREVRRTPLYILLEIERGG